MAYLDITKDLSKEGRQLVEIGQVLIFDYEGNPVYLKIMRKARGQVYAKRLDPDLFLTPEQADERIIIKKK